ncbi:MAG: NnrS family protein [Parvibaculum sp.]
MSIRQIALFSYGFRTFFLGGALWAFLAMLIWIGLLAGEAFPLGLAPAAWHAHEFLFGYVGAIIAGFLLTAVPNWTGRTPLQGVPLLSLFILWLVGRIAFLLAGQIGYLAAAIADSIFLVALAAFVFREVMTAENKGNIRIAVILSVLALANILFHVEIITQGQPVFTLRGTISLIVILISVIGGRVVPNFTRNWLMRRGDTRVPTPTGRFDQVVLASSVMALAFWTFLPELPVTALFLFAVGIMHAVRLGRWSGWRTGAEPIVLILHIGYAFVPLGFVLVALSFVWPFDIPLSAALHAWTSGAMGVMTLAIMTRATRGHCGHPLTAPPATQFIYLMVVAAALLRLSEIIIPDAALMLRVASGGTWLVAFAGFIVAYGPMLLRPRAGSAQG